MFIRLEPGSGVPITRQIADQISISQMHVSRLERAALQKLRLVLMKNAAAINAPDSKSRSSQRKVSTTAG